MKTMVLTISNSSQSKINGYDQDSYLEGHNGVNGVTGDDDDDGAGSGSNSSAGGGDSAGRGCDRLVETLPRAQGRSRRDMGSDKIHYNNRSQSFLSRLIRNLSSHSISASYNNISNGGDDVNRAGVNYRSLRRPRSKSSHRGGSGKLSSSISSQEVVNGGVNLKPTTALCGIKNHGNTCFMNAILQCLAHTDILAEYFVMNHYKIDLNKHNKLNLCKYGPHGEVTAQCALLFISLRTNTYSPDISSKFKYLVSKYCKQYEGNEQHDAQEFLFFLLDIFHEDLNIATKKKAKKFKQIQKNWNKPDELIAAETLAYHMRCDSSFIHDLFQAQLRSSLVCRSCNNHSNTFDPYMCLSLPVPTKLTHTIIINVSYLDDLPKQVRMVVTIEAQSTLRELRDKISRLVKIPERQLVLLVKDIEHGLKELTNDKLFIHELLDDVDDVEVEAIETSPCLPQWGAEMRMVSSSSSLSPSQPSTPPSQQLILVWTNRVGIGTENKVFGPFFSCSITREASFKEIQLEMMKTMQPILRKTCDLTVIKDSCLFSLKVVDGIPGKCYLPEDVDHPLYMPTVDKALSQCEEKDYRGPVHLKLIIEWDLDLRQTLLVDDDDILIVVDDPNIEYVKARNEMANRATLKDCFDMYFREERLGADNAWMCPACKKRQQCIKKLSLWSTPDVFIIHLKRFRQASTSHRTKLSTLVLFPLTGLDMNPYLTNRSNLPPAAANDYANNVRNSSYALSPWRRPRLKTNFPRPEDNIYDLYAVCNHHGNMQAGHYTAYCCNTVDRKWYSFDDQKVTPISERSVVTADAYILFYQRRTLSSSPLTSCTGSSVSSSSTSSNSFSTNSSYPPSDQWTNQLSSSNRSSPGPGKSHDNLSPSNHHGSDSPFGNNRIDNHQPNRGSRAYSTLPSRGPSDQTKAKKKDSTDHSRSISPPIKISQNSLPAFQTRQQSKESRVAAVGPSSGSDGKYKDICPDQQEISLIDEAPQPLHSPSLQENSRFWTVTSV